MTRDDDFVERRKFPRRDLRPEDDIWATLVLSGNSLIHSRSPDNQIEIRGIPVNISRGGVCVEISFEAPWQSIVTRSEVDLVLTKENVSRSMRARVVHTRRGTKTLGIAFEAPVGDLAPLLLPRELQKR